MSDLETQLREAIYKAGRGAVENGTDAASRRILAHFSVQGPKYVEAYLNEIGNGYVNLVLPTILPIINQHIEENQR